MRYVISGARNYPGGPAVPKGGRVAKRQEASSFALLADRSSANHATRRAAKLRSMNQPTDERYSDLRCESAEQ